MVRTWSRCIYCISKIFTEQECLPFLIREQNKHKYYVNPTTIPNLFLELLQFDPLCITEDLTENDNRPFQSIRTPTEINMILDQQEPENTQSILSTQTNQQFSDTNTNRQIQTTNTFNVDARTINTINSPPPQQELNINIEDQINQQLQIDNVQPLPTQISSTRSNITLQPQNQNLFSTINRTRFCLSIHRWYIIIIKS